MQKFVIFVNKKHVEDKKYCKAWNHCHYIQGNIEVLHKVYVM